jgi:hypothetical protein
MELGQNIPTALQASFAFRSRPTLTRWVRANKIPYVRLISQAIRPASSLDEIVSRLESLKAGIPRAVEFKSTEVELPQRSQGHVKIINKTPASSAMLLGRLSASRLS